MNAYAWTELAHEFGLFLLGVTVKASLLVALLVLVDRFGGWRRAAWRSLLWIMGLLGLLLVPLAPALLPALRIPVQTGALPAPVVGQLVQPSRPGPIPEPAVGRRPAPTQPNTQAAIAQDRAHVSRPWASLSSGQLWTTVGVAAYLVGLSVFWIRLVVGLIRIRRLRRQAAPITDPELRDCLQDLRARFGLQRVVSLAASESVSGPTQVGLREPTIVLPTAMLSGSSRGALESILAHELAHALRYDYLLNLLAAVVLAVHWFNPLSWLAGRRLRQANEQACDDRTVELLGNPHAYAQTVLQVAAGQQLGRLEALGASMAGLTPIKRRIDRITALGDRVVPRTGRPAATAIILAVTASALALGCAKLGGSRPSGDDDPEPSGYASSASAVAAPPARPAGDAELIDRIRRAVVQVSIRSEDGLSMRSGAVVASSGLILTSMVHGPGEIVVRLDKGREVAAELVGYDPIFELAILRVQNALMDTVGVAARTPAIGDRVIAAGFGMSSTMGGRHVFAAASGAIVNDRFETRGITAPGYHLATDIQIDPGMNLLFTADGDLLSVMAGTASPRGVPPVAIRGTAPGGAPENGDVRVDQQGHRRGPAMARLGDAPAAVRAQPAGMSHSFFYPLPDIPPRIVQAVHEGVVLEHGWLRIIIDELEWSDAAAAGLDGTDGVLVKKIVPGSPVEGVLQPGDIIVQVGGSRIRGPMDLRRVILGSAPGSSVAAVLWRPGEGAVTTELRTTSFDDGSKAEPRR